MADGGVGIDDNNDEDDDDCEALTKPVTMILMKVSVLFWMVMTLAIILEVMMMIYDNRCDY